MWKIRKLAEGGRYQLPALCERFSAGRAARPEELRPREAWKLIEMLKAAAGREARSQEPEKRRERRGAEAQREIRRHSLFPSTPASELCASAPRRSI